jgi:SWI/SNF-related matrix-associated actin-dependent regulator 1 of chromatin subfamily A
LRKKKVAFICITGATDQLERVSLVESFQTNDFLRFAVLSITACGVGLTLTAASTIIFAELSWTPWVMIQAEDRAHRIGQDKPVNIYYLHAKDTVDDVILQMLHDKSQIVHDILD